MKEELNNNYDKNDELELNKNILYSPFELLNKYGIVPWNMILHFALVILTTCQIVLIETSVTNFSRHQEHLLYNVFLENSTKEGNSFNRYVYIYSIEELRNHINSTYYNYLSLHNNSIDFTSISKDNPVIEFIYYDNHIFYDTLTDITNQLPTYNINKTSLGPFDDPNIKEFLNDVVIFRINYTLFTYKPYLHEDNLECLKWEIIQIYDFAQRNHFIVKLDITNHPCFYESIEMSFFDEFVNKLIWIHYMVLIIAIISLKYSWSYITLFAAVYMKSKQKESDEDDGSIHTKSSDSIYYNPLMDKDYKENDENNIENKDTKDMHHKPHSLFYKSNHKSKSNIYEEHKDKYSKFQFWTTICLLGNMIQIFGSCVAISYPDNILDIESILVGLGCLMAFFNVARYIEFNSTNFSIFYDVVNKAFPIVLRYLGGVFPIFLGFLFFGMCVFWKSERFANPSISMYSLFSIIQGDNIYDTFQNLKGINFFIGQLYCYCYCSLLIFVVWNIFIAIVEESYVISKLRNKTSWIYQYMELEPELVNLNVPTNTLKKKKEEYFKRNSFKLSKSNSLKSYDALINKRSKSMIEGKIKSNFSDKNKWIDHSSVIEENIIEKCDQSKINELSTKLSNEFQKLEVIYKQSLKDDDKQKSDELKIEIFDRLKLIQENINKLRTIWLNSK